MKKFVFIIVSIIALMGSRIEGQSRMPADSIAAWQSDIDYLAEKLIQIHPRYKDCGLKEDLNNAKANIKQKIGSLTDAQIAVELQKLLASAGDGHTILYPFGMKKGTLLRIPLMFWLFDDGLFVVDAPQRQLIGQKVLSIGSFKVDELLLNLTPYISHDNTQQFLWAAPFYCTLTDFLMAAGAIKNRDSVAIVFGNNVKYSFTAKPVDPEKLEIKLIPPLNGIAPDYLIHRNENFRVKNLRPDVLYVAVNSMNDTPQKTLEEFGKELKKLLKPYKKLVLDLRYNNGGEASKADELFKTCVAFDAEGGKIAVLAGRMTFSAAQTFATRIDQWTSAFFVGEKTGSKPNHYGNERQFKLPFSGLRGSMSSGYNQPVSANDSRMFISPEIEVRVNSESFFSGKDPEVDAALNELNKY